jgi:hypothetical protein
MIRNILLGIAVLLAALTATVYVIAWRSPPTLPYAASPTEYPLMSWDDYRQVASRFEPPVIRQYDLGGGGAVLFFGAQHSGNREHPQFAALADTFEDFDPDIVLVEGRLGFLLPGFMDPVETYGESGFAVAEARRRGLDYFSWELSKADEITALRERFPREQVAMFIILRPFLSNNYPGQTRSPEDRLQHYIRERGNRPGIEGEITDVSEIDAIWQRDFPDATDWRELRFGTALPGYLGELFEAANNVRDAHMLNAVSDLAGEGQRVLVIAGWSHVVRIEPVFEPGSG